MIWTKDLIKEMQGVDITTVDRSVLTDLKDITIDTKKPLAHKLKQFSEQTENIFINKVEDYVVKVNYLDTEATINDRFISYIERLKLIDI